MDCVKQESSFILHLEGFGETRWSRLTQIYVTCSGNYITDLFMSNEMKVVCWKRLNYQVCSHHKQKQTSRRETGQERHSASQILTTPRD